MAASPRQPDLIPDCRPVGPGAFGTIPGKRGRGATPQRVRVVELFEANAVGRSKLTFRYRPLQAWDPQRLDVVERLLERYFTAFGGFRLVDDAIIRAWYEALDVYTEQEIVWACKAKVAQLAAGTPEERQEKRKFVASPANAPGYFGRWLQASPEYQAAQQQQRDQDRARQLDEIRVSVTQAARRGQEQNEELAAQIIAKKAREKAEREARRAAYWDSLSRAQRLAAFKAIESAWAERCKEWGVNPEDPSVDAVHRDWAIQWAQFQWPMPDSSGAHGPLARQESQP